MIGNRDLNKSRIIAALMSAVFAIVLTFAMGDAAFAEDVSLEPQHGIPLVIVRIDESDEAIAAAEEASKDKEGNIDDYGTIAEMHSSEEHSVRCTGTVLRKPVRARKAIRVRWKRQKTKMAKSRITGYQIQLATNKQFTKNKRTMTLKGYKWVSKKVKKLKRGKKYYVRVRTYKTVKGVKYYSPWSKTRSVKTR